MPTQTGSIDFKSTKGFQSYASGQYTTKTEFDNLEIGGRNLLYNTADWSSWACTAKATVSNGVLTTTNTDTSAYQRANGWFTLAKADLVDRVITISFEAKKTDATALDALCLQLFTTSAAPKSVQSGNIAEGTRCYLRLNSASTDKIAIKNASAINANTWTKVSVTYKPSEVLNTSGYTDYAYLALYIGIINKTGSAQYRNIKAEFGNRATDWSPAPEDATERIVKAETAIEQTANNVLIKATQSDTTAAQGGQHLIESLINVAPSGVKIAASKVEIDGTAVFKAANAIPDTRSNNQPPSWYFTNYPRQSVTEFKTSSVMGLTGETYCYVTTVTGWNDKSGGYPKQTAQIAGKTYWRVGVSDSAWGTWQETESTAGSQAKVDALEIGGRNLLPGTETLDGFVASVTGITFVDGVLTMPGNASGWDRAHTPIVPFSKVDGNNITVSFEYRADVTTHIYICTEGLAADTVDGARSKYKDHQYDLPAKSEWARWSVTFPNMSVAYLTQGSGDVSYFRLALYNRTNNSNLKVRFPKMEKGDKATDWSPAPEDQTAYVDESISAIQIGGRNLLRNSLEMKLGTTSWKNGVWRVAGNADMTKSHVEISDGPLGQCGGLQLVGTQTTTTDTSCYGIDSMPRDVGGDYVISMFARVVGGGVARAGFAINSAAYAEGNDDGRWASYYTKTLDTTGKWTRIWKHWKSTAATGNVYIGGAATDTSSKTIQMCLVQIERGTKPTDWTLAPEEMVRRTQRIWYRKSVEGAPATPGTASSNWVVKPDDGSNAWTKMHISITETEKFIYTCEQYEMGDGTIGYTSVLLDNTITVIDGGKIITGSVTADQIAAGTITGEQIAVDTIEGGNIKGNAITAEHLSSAFSLDLGKVDGLKERLESIEGGVSRLQDNTQWVHYDQVAGTVFGESGSANNVTVKGGGIDFNTDEGRAAWATGGVFHANEMEAGTIDTQTITMGDWAIVQSGSSFYIDYIGS